MKKAQPTQTSESVSNINNNMCDGQVINIFVDLFLFLRWTFKKIYDSIVCLCKTWFQIADSAPVITASGRRVKRRFSLDEISGDHMCMVGAACELI